MAKTAQGQKFYPYGRVHEGLSTDAEMASQLDSILVTQETQTVSTSASKKVLITDEAHTILISGLQQEGFEVSYQPTITLKEVEDIIGEYEGLIINSRVPASAALLRQAKKLKFVCRLGSGLEVIDLEAARLLKIAAFNSPEGNRQAVAEHSLGMLLSIMNNMPRASEQIKHHEWVREQNRGNELKGKTVALLAYGNTAQALTKLLIGFDVNILAYDKYATGFTNDFVLESSLENIFERADVLSIHLPLTPETNFFVDYSFLSKFKKPIWLVNTSRGKVLRTADLLRSMDERRVIAAALDVLENENLSSFTDEESETYSKLIANNRILITPHIAGWTHESKRKIAEVLLEKIRALYP